MRIAEVNEKTVTKVLSDVPPVSPKGLIAHLLVGPHTIAEIFCTQAFSKLRGTYEVTKHHRKLSFLSIEREA